MLIIRYIYEIDYDENKTTSIKHVSQKFYGDRKEQRQAGFLT